MKRQTLPLLLLLLALVWPANAKSNVVPSAFERSFQMEGSGCSDLKWTVDRETLQLTIQWKSSPGADWTAFGISEFGGMKGADIALVKTKPDDTGSFQVEDLFSTEYGLPELDLLQNVDLLEAFVNDNDDRIQVTIRRDLDTCDQQDLQIKPQKQYLICASGSSSEDDDNTPMYHGPHRSTGMVNLMVDEELLFERILEPPPRNTTKSYLATGVTAHAEDPQTAVSTFPLDIQMPNITLDATATTSYRCRAFQLDDPMKFTAYEAVWGDGITTSSTGESNDILHHQILYICKDPSVLEPSYLSNDGETWDCFAKMPACEVVAANARGSGLNEVPAGLHFSLQAGTYVHLVHYENPYGRQVINDQSGFRLWAEPSTSHTKPAMLAAHEGKADSLIIPADPLQREITLQFLISAEATRATLPPGGVQAFGSVLHMHKLGVRGRVELIRDGEHILDVYNAQSYDFDRQTPDFHSWRFLPGDALIVSCTFKPDKERTVKGGFRTMDEMGLFFLAFAPEVPNYGYAMGSFVKEGEPFLNSHMGVIDNADSAEEAVNARHLNYTDYKYQPVPKDPASIQKSLKEYRKNVCQTFVRQDLIINTITFSDPAVYAQLIVIATFLFVTILSKPRVLSWFLGRKTPDSSSLRLNIRDRRNATVYVGQLIFSTIVLPFLCWELAQIFQEDDSFDVVHPNKHIVARGIMVTQALLYLLELIYRIEVRFSLVIHHLMTSFTVLYLGIVLAASFQLLVLKFGITLTLLAVTEQPLYLVLLLRLTGYRERSPKIWPILCRVTCGVFVVTRLIIMILTIVLVVQQSQPSDIAWQILNVSFGHWHLPANPFWSSPQWINAMLCVFATGILFSNYFAVKAMIHMSSSRNKRGQDENEDLQITDIESSCCQDAASRDDNNLEQQ